MAAQEFVVEHTYNIAADFLLVARRVMFGLDFRAFGTDGEFSAARTTAA
jgi:hypothetical protein